MNKIRSGFFAVTEHNDPQGHVDYNWWHSSDHIPENLGLEGVVWGTRWAAPKRYMDARLAVHPGWANHQYLVHYLMTDPLGEALKNFSELGATTRALGRFFGKRTILSATHNHLLKGYVAPRVNVSVDALPFRPHTGVFVVMKDLKDPSKQQECAQWHDRVHIPDVLTVKGVMGAYWFQSMGQHVGSDGVGDPNSRQAFLYYLDEEPLDVMADLREKLPQWQAAGRILDTSRSMETILAGPYETIADPKNYDWNDR